MKKVSLLLWGAAPSPAKPFLERKGLDPKEVFEKKKMIFFSKFFEGGRGKLFFKKVSPASM